MAKVMLNSEKEARLALFNLKCFCQRRPCGGLSRTSTLMEREFANSPWGTPLLYPRPKCGRMYGFTLLTRKPVTYLPRRFLGECNC